MTTSLPPAIALYTPEERKSGQQVRELFLKIFKTWTPEDFARIIASRNAVDPVFLWNQMFSNPITRIAGNVIKSQIKPENAARIFAGFNVKEVIGQIRDHRQDLLTLAQSPDGQTWIKFYLDGFKQCMCPHVGFVAKTNEVIHCTLCGARLQ